MKYKLLYYFFQFGINITFERGKETSTQENVPSKFPMVSFVPHFHNSAHAINADFF